MSTEQRTRPVDWTAAFMLIVCFGFVLLFLFPRPQPDASAGRAEATNNLKQIALAIISFSGTNRRMPPAAIYSADGKPLLSWRVLILPYIDEGDLFEQFRLNEPWNSPHNLKLLDKMPLVYAPPPATKAAPHSTFFRVFVGPGAAFEGRQGLRYPEDFPDGTSKTILVVDAAEAVPWTKPDELAYSPDQPLPEVGGLFRDVFVVVMADGSAKAISKHVSKETLRAAITRNGRDTLGSDWPDD